MTAPLRVFDNIKCDLSGGATPTVGAFEYLNRSKRIEAQRVRELIETWFSHFPVDGQEGLRRDLRDADNTKHHSSFFELAVHELLHRQSHQIVVHPTIPTGAKRPDFLVTPRNSQPFYVEATLSTGQSDLERSAQRRLDEVLACLDKMASKDFLLGVSYDGVPKQSVATTRLRSELQQWLDGLDYDQVARSSMTDFEDDPLVFRRDLYGLNLVVKAIARGDRQAVPERAVGLLTGGAKWLDVNDGLRSSIRNKAKRYGKLDAPFVIAINALNEFVEMADIADAVFGRMVLRVPIDGAGNGHWVREPDGLLRGHASDPEFSAVLATYRLTPWTLSLSGAGLIANPWAPYPLDGEALPLQPLNNCPRAMAATPVRELFDLPDNWPGEKSSWPSAAGSI